MEKHLVFGQFKFSSIFLRFSLVTINRQTLYDSGMLRQEYGIIRDFTPVSFVKTTESYENSFVTINGQTSHDSGIFRLPMDHTSLDSTFTETDKTGGLNYRIGPDCNSWFL